MAATYVANMLRPTLCIEQCHTVQLPMFYVNMVCGIWNGMQMSLGLSSMAEEVGDRNQ